MTDYRNREPIEPYGRPCPVDPDPLNRALGWLTLAGWAAFLVLAVPVPLVLWWWS